MSPSNRPTHDSITARGAVSFALLVVFWVILWRDLSWANVFSGVLAAAFVRLLFPVYGGGTAGRIRPLALLGFVAFTVRAVVKANVVVAWEVITPNDDTINEAVVAVPLATRRPGVVTLVSHAISLAPGTVVIDITEPDDPTAPVMLHIHVLHFRTIEAVRAEVLDLERRALAVFPDAALPSAPDAPALVEEQR